jgi:VWFA-related protein
VTRLGLAACACAAAFALAVVAQEQPQRRGFAVTIAEPANQSVVLGRTRIVADVAISDPTLVDRVEFFVGDELILVDREPPYEAIHDFGNEARSWVIRAVAWHGEGVSVDDAVISRKIEFGTVESVDRVLMWLVARDAEGNLVTDLERDDVRLFEAGAPREILDFEPDRRPVNLAILLDTSQSTRGTLPAMQDAIVGFLGAMRPDDRAFVIDFSDDAYLIQDLTSDREALTSAIKSTEAIGGTALVEALQAAYRKLESIDGRKAIVVVSHGGVYGDKRELDRVAERAKASNLVIYAIGLTEGEGAAPEKKTLRELAEATGGRFWLVKKADRLAEAYETIAAELASQYFASYAPDLDDWNGKWVPIRVESTRSGVEIRTRTGFLAVRGVLGSGG